MNTRFLISFFALGALAAAIVWQYMSSRERYVPPSPAIYDTQETAITGQSNQPVVENQQAIINELARNFIHYYVEALDGDDEAAAAARDLLSWRAQTVVDRDPTLIAGLRRLTRHLPESTNVEIISSRKVSDQFAEVKTLWHYPEENLERYLYILIEDGAWRVDSVQTIPQ